MDMTVTAPVASFDDVPPPAAPDYEDISNPWVWLAWPGRRNPAEDTRVVDEVFVPEDERPCDCFFVHPTTSIPMFPGHIRGAWNCPVDDPAADNKGLATTQGVATGQASCFNQSCRVYMPRYRQICITSYGAGAAPERAASTLKAMDLAYGDVRRAFERFLRALDSSHGPTAPFVLASHSQGTMHVKRLILEVIDPNVNLARRLVAAYLIGNNVPHPYVERLQHLRLADTAAATNAIIAFDAVPSGYTPTPDVGMRKEVQKVWVDLNPSVADWLAFNRAEVVATNVLSFAPGGRYLGLALMNSSTGEPKVRALRAAPLDDSFADALQVKGGFIWCRKPSECWPASEPAMPKFLTALENSGPTLHNMEYMIFYHNIRADVARRCEAFVSGSRSKL